MDDQCPLPSAPAVIDAGAPNVPAADSDRAVRLAVQPFISLWRGGKFDNERVAVSRRDRLAIGRAGKEAGAANGRQVGIGPLLVHLAEQGSPVRIGQPIFAVGRTPLPNLVEPTVVARRVTLAALQVLAQLRIGEFVEDRKSTRLNSSH